MISTATIPETEFDAAYRALQTQRLAEPLWLARMRASALEDFRRTGLPTTHNEDWKYTGLAQINSMIFEPAGTADADAAIIETDIRDQIFPECATSVIVIFNGRFNPALSNTSAIPDAVTICNLATCLGEAGLEALLKEHMGRVSVREQSALQALNTALFSDLVLLHVPAGVEVQAPIQLLFVVASGPDARAVFPRALIVADADARATVIESYSGQGQYLCNNVTELRAGTKSTVKHYKIQRESSAAFHLGTTNVAVHERAAYDSTAINFGAKLARHDIDVSLTQPHSEVWVDGLYFAQDAQHTDTHALIDHVAPHCTSHQLYKGILDGSARAVFNGRIVVRKDAQKTDAQQTNRNLLLSNLARVDTKPQLEILADDVKCAHGATVGQLEDDELFYLISRGLHPELARHVLTYGFAEEVIDKLPIASLKTQLDAAVLQSLHATLEA